MSDCCFRPNELFQLHVYHSENRLLNMVLNTIKLTLNIKQIYLSYFKLNSQGGRRGRDRIVVGFTTTCVMPITT